MYHSQYYIYIIPILLGFYFELLGNLFGLQTGIEGVQYYGEAHLSLWNSNIHSLLMPFTTFGILLFFPNILQLFPAQAMVCMNLFYLFYLIHYLSINIAIGTIFGIVYFIPLQAAKVVYQLSFDNFICGFILTFACLTCQECIGHYLGGDIPSRPEGILNAILYANYYALSNIYIY